MSLQKVTRKHLLLLLSLIFPFVVSANTEIDLRAIAQSLNKGTPRMIDSNTRFEAAYATSNTMHWKLTLVNHTSRTMDSAAKMGLKKKVVTGTCKNTQMVKKVLAKGIQLHMTYLGTDKKPILNIYVRHADCY